MIHPTAIVDAKAQLGNNVCVGPYSIIGPEVTIQDNTWIGPHVVIQGPTNIGKNNKFYQFSSIGEDPQDKKFAGEKAYLEIGHNNVFREFMTISRGTGQGGGVTTIGSNNLLMAYVHIAHDCTLGNDITFSNNASLAGHVKIHDYANLGGFVGVHQFTEIGSYCFCAGGSIITKDVPPYMMIAGHPAEPHGLNLVGLKRRGFSEIEMNTLKQAYKLLYRQNLTIEEAIQAMNALVHETPEVQLLIDFIEKSERGIVR